MEKRKLILVDGAELPYHYEQGVFYFEQDIQIGEWTVRKEISCLRDRGPSSYMYDWTDHLDFKVVDRDNIERLIPFYYNNVRLCADYNEITGLAYGVPELAIKHFLHNYKPFLYSDWAHFPANYITDRIREVLDSENTAEGKLRQIEKTIRQVKCYLNN